jgi:hypothetical protein
MSLTVGLHHNVIPEFYWDAGQSAARLIPRLVRLASKL